MKIKKILAAAMAVVFSLSTSLNQVSAAPATLSSTESGTGAQSVSTLADGFYAVPLSLSGRGNAANYQNIQDKYCTALVEVKDGDYTATLRIGTMCLGNGTDQSTQPDRMYEKHIKILKDEYTWEDVGTKTGTLSAGKYDDDTYWRTDVIQENNESYDYADFTFTLADPEKTLTLAFNSTNPNGQYNQISFSWNQAAKFPEINAGSYTWKYIVDNSYEKEKNKGSTNIPVTGSPLQISENVSKVLEDDVQVEIGEDKNAKATFTLTEYGKSLENPIYLVKSNTNKTEGRSTYRQFWTPYTENNYEAITISDDGTFTLEYDLSDYKDMAFGTMVRICLEEGGSEEYPTERMVYGTLRLSETSVKPITLTDETGNFEYKTTTINAPSGSTLVVEELTEGDVYESWANQMDGTSKAYKVYSLKVLNSGGEEIALTQNGTLTIKAPSDWTSYNQDYTYIWHQDVTGAARLAGDYENSTFTVNETKLDETYCIQASLDPSTNSNTLENGTYLVNFYLKLDGTTGSSMSDAAFAKPGKLIVSDDGVRLEITQSGFLFSGEMAYVSRVMYSADGGETYQNAVYTSYVKNDDNSYYQDKYTAGRYVYYPYIPESIYLELPKDHDGNYQMKFRVPIMAGLNDVDSGSFNLEKVASLVIDFSTAEKQDKNIPDAPIKEALQSAIDLAEDLQDHWEEIDPSAYNSDTIETAVNNAKTALEGESSENQRAAYGSLQAEIDKLTDSYIGGKDQGQGLYVTTAQTQGSEITSVRVQVNEDQTTDIRLYTNGVEKLAYYDLDTRTYIELEKQTDAFDNEFFAYTLPKAISSGTTGVSIYTSQAMKFTNDAGANFADIEGNWVTLGELGDEQLQDELDWSGYNEIYAAAQDILKESSEYYPNGIEAIQKALAQAMEVKADAMTIQSEIDALIQVFEEAIELAVGEVDYSELQTAIEHAKEAAAKTEVYTPSSIAALNEAIEEAVNMLSNENVTAYELHAMINRLNAEVESLIPQADKTELQSLIETAEEIENDNYSGYDNLISILESAKEVLNDDNATAEEVQDMIAALTAAISNLDDSVNKDDLRNLVDQAEGLIADGTYVGCTKESLNLLNSALTAAKAVLEDASASQADVDRHYQMIVDADGAMLKEQDGMADGVYETAVTVLQATDTDGTQTSMAHSAVVDHKAQVVVKNGVPTAIRLTFQPLTITNLTGYLETIGYYANYHDAAVPNGLTATRASVLSYYTDEEVSETFAYNDGVDPFASFRQTEGSYLKTVEIPVESDGNGGYYTEYWIQVYVPVMASISQASGTQNAKLRLDIESWTDMTQISGATDTDKASLEQEIRNASALLDEVSGGSYRSEDVSVLEVAVTAGNVFNNNMNIDQTMVEKMVTALQSAQNLFTTQTIDSDKETLSDRITEAEEALSREDVTYTDASRQNLEWVLNAAKVVYENPEATQTQVSWWAERLRQAIDGLNVISADKTELQAALKAAQERLKDTENYSGASLDTLQSLYDSALAVYEDTGSSQTDIDRNTSVLNYYLNSMVQLSESSEVVKDGLYAMLMTASNLAGRENLYTKESLNALKVAIKMAQEIYDKEDVTWDEVTAQVNALYQAVLDLEAKPSETPGTGTGDGGSGNDNDDGGNNDGNTDLDIANLADGVYSIYGEMVKTDKTSESMSNAAVNHTIKLTVENGKYYITMNFNGLQYAGQYGYLKDLQYFLTGYTTNQYGVPQGDLADVTIDSYQTDSDGNRISDSFGTDYPDYVTFELIPEALEDGFVPLQVFVPIMESIADGTGTQAVYLKLDWSSLKLTEADDPDFEDDGNNDNNNNNNGNGNGGSGLSGGSGLGNNTLGSTLGGSSLGGSSLGGSSLGGSSLGGSSLKSGSSLTGASSVKTDDTSSDISGWATVLAIGCMALLVGVLEKRSQKKNRGM